MAGEHRLRYAALLLALALPLAASAQVYRWVDEQGKVHYSDTPPPKAQAEALDVHTGPTSSEQVSAQRKARENRIEQIEQTQAVEKKIDALKAKKAARKEKLCAAAREWQTKIQLNRRLYEVNAQGEREYYSSAEIDAARAKAAADVEKYCE